MYLFALIFCLLLISGLISAGETAVFSISPEDLNLLKRSQKKCYRHLEKFRTSPTRFISTIIISNTLLNTGIIVLAVFLIKENQWSQNTLSFLLQIFIISSIILLGGEILPKTIAKNHALKISKATSSFIYILYIILSPISKVIDNVSKALTPYLKKHTKDLSIKDLTNAIEMATEETQELEESKILKGIVNFGDIEVNSIMRPRIYVQGVEAHSKFEKVMELISDAGYSRMPVYDDNIDHIIGVLHIKDVLPYINHIDFEWTKLIRQAVFVPETQKIDLLLKELKELKVHLAIVVNEYGGTSGIVTMEDILEEILGDISDEFDNNSDDVLYQKIGDSLYICDARMPIIDFCKLMKIDNDFFDNCCEGEFESLAGLILEKLGIFPVKNQTIEVPPFTFTIESIDKKRIKKIRVKVNTHEN